MKNKFLYILLISMFFFQGMISDGDARKRNRNGKVYLKCREGDPTTCARLCRRRNQSPMCTYCIDLRDKTITVKSCGSPNKKKQAEEKEVFSKLPSNCKLQPPRACRRVCASRSQITFAPCAICKNNKKTPDKFLLCGFDNLIKYTHASELRNKMSDRAPAVGVVAHKYKENQEPSSRE